MSYRVRVILLALLAIGFTLYNAFRHYDQGSLIYDEGDYYLAVRNGFWNNWMDADDVPTLEFIHIGLQAVRGEISRSEMSKMIRGRKSSAFHRHYHPPFAFYHAILTRNLAPDIPLENQLRFGTFGLMILWIIILALLALKEPDLFTPWFVLVPASANWIASACAFNMHVPFGLAMTTMMICWYAFEKDRSKVWIKRAGLFALAIAVCSVEYSLMLLGMMGLWMLFTLWKQRKVWRKVLRIRLIDLLWFTGFLLVIWPAGVLKLGILKSYIHQVYIAMFRLEGHERGFTSFRTMIDWKWTSSPMELLLLIGLVAGMIWGWQKVLKRGSLFVSLGLVLAICYVQFDPVLVLRWYLFPVFCVAFAFWCHVMAERADFSAMRSYILAIVGAVLLFGLAQMVIQLPSYTKAKDIRDAITALSKPGTPLVVVQGFVPPMSAYFPDRKITGIHWLDVKKPEVLDSLPIWAKDHVLVLSDDVEHSLEVDTVIEGTSIIAP